MYIVVYVTYDHYRFQHNCFASESKKECKTYIRNKGEDVYDYKMGSKVETELWEREKPHYWIEKL